MPRRGQLFGGQGERVRGVDKDGGTAITDLRDKAGHLTRGRERWGMTAVAPPALLRPLAVDKGRQFSGYQAMAFSDHLPSQITCLLQKHNVEIQFRPCSCHLW